MYSHMIKKYSEFAKELNISWFGKKSKNFYVNNLSVLENNI